MGTGSRTKNRLSKAEQARRTRERITAAATTLFVRDGFLTTTMAAIAAEAGVAVQTLYLAFGNKTAILHAAFDDAIAGDDNPTPVMQRQWWRDMMAARDGVTALTVFVDSSCEIQHRVGPLYGVIRAAAADPDVAELLDANKRERRAGFRVIAEHLSSRPGFAKDLDAEDAAAHLYAVQSEETHALLVDECGWTVQQWRDWVLRTAMNELFPQQSPATKRPRQKTPAPMRP